jgi:hypothetical protein
LVDPRCREIWNRRSKGVAGKLRGDMEISMGDQKRIHEGQGKMHRGARQEMQGRSMGNREEFGENLRRCIKILDPK